jgi:hypothetical protein
MGHMSVKNCIDGKGKKGIVDRALSKQAMDLFDLNRARIIGNMSAADADAQAGARLIAYLKEKLALKKENIVRQASAASDIEKFMNEFRTSGGQANAGAAAFGVLNRSPRDQVQYSNVWARQQAVHNQLIAAADDVIINYRKRLGGFPRGRVSQKNMIRELDGIATGDEVAKLAAAAWTKSSIMGLERFNRAGGNIPIRKDWLTIRSHDTERVGKSTPDEWIAFITPLLGPDKMIDEATGLPMTSGRLYDFLLGAHQEIRTDGWGARELSFQTGKTMLAHSRQQSRRIHFRDADAWLEYHDKYGKGGIFDAMTGHLENLSMDIAMMEVLGPNPLAMVMYMGDLLRKKASTGTAKQMAKAEKDALTLILDFHELSGKNSILKTGIARGASTTKNYLNSSLLSSAFLVAFPSDLWTSSMTAAFNGSNPAKVIHNLLRVMSPGGKEWRRFAVQAGLGADHYSSMALGQARIVGDILGSKMSQMTSDVMMTITGLSPWTQGIRWAAGLANAGSLGKRVGTPFSEMPGTVVRQLGRYGISEAEWMSLATMSGRKSIVGEGVLMERGGDTFLSGPAVMQFDENLGTKISQLIATETEVSALTAIPRVRRQLRGGADPNSISGVVMQSASSYLSWPVGIIHTHLMRGLNQQGYKKGTYLFALMTGLTFMGALSVQMYNAKQGRQFEDMTKPKFWMRAFVKGGSLGLFGDFLLQDPDRYGRDIASQSIGPLAGVVGDVFSLTAGNVWQAARGERMNVGGESVDFVKRYMPGTSMWYTTLIAQRMMYDQINMMVNPRAAESFRRSESALRSETGQQYFWGKGDRTPSRAPDFGAAIGR